MIHFIIEYKTIKPIVLCQAAGFLQPLAAVYYKDLLPVIEKHLAITDSEQDNALHRLFTSTTTQIIYPQKQSFYRDDLFFNINTAEDYRHWKAC